MATLFGQLDSVNRAWFAAINADAGLAGWSLLLAVFTAEWLILAAPLGLVLLWLRGGAAARQAAVRAALAVVVALTLNGVIGAACYHGRPFAVDVGNVFLLHAPTSSFPSNHGTIMLVSALVLASSAAPAARRLGGWLLPASVAVAWSRVYLGVHWPLDMAGALLVALGMAWMSRLGAVSCASAALAGLIEDGYRRVFARMIARGWLSR